ncbi:MAG: transposase family protein [Bacteroidia bacterium]
MNTEILYLSPTYTGKVHDKKICNEEKLQIKTQGLVFVDLGFVGLTSDSAQIITPHKRKKNKELTQSQEQYNSWLAKIRVKIEHVMASIKIYRKVKEKYRGRLYKREDTIMLVACALHNLKLKAKSIIN